MTFKPFFTKLGVLKSEKVSVEQAPRSNGIISIDAGTIIFRHVRKTPIQDPYRFIPRRNRRQFAPASWHRSTPQGDPPKKVNGGTTFMPF
jgi:hypothetical protein